MEIECPVDQFQQLSLSNNYYYEFISRLHIIKNLPCSDVGGFPVAASCVVNGFIARQAELLKHKDCENNPQ